MRNLAAASVAAFAALVISAHVAASAINAREHRLHEGWGGLTEMAQATPDQWYIKGVITLAAGGTRDVQYMVPDADRGGRPALLTFDSQDACDEARTKDPEIAGSLVQFGEIVKSRGDSVVVSCAKWEHPAVKPPGKEI